MQLVPYDWRDCLQFRGAKDIGFLKYFMMQYAPQGLHAISDPIKGDSEIRAAENDKYLFLYLPTPGIVDFSKMNLEVTQCKVVDLDKRRILNGQIENNTLQLLPVVEDELIIVKK